MEIILASSSPRRKELLGKLNLKFKCIPSKINEDFNQNESKEAIVKSLAIKKGLEVFNQYPNEVIISADTIIYLDRVIMKPVNKENAYDILKALSGKRHSVLTAVAFFKKNYMKVILSEAFVTFKNLSDHEIYTYIETGEPFDKAGGYGIQGEGKKLVLKYEGDLNTIIGFPLDMVEAELMNLGII